MAAEGFAVIDFETTGLFPGGHDRVIEVAVVHADQNGRVTGQWETLINPERDLGRQDIHHIRASDVMDAPRFKQIASRFVELLENRVIVAHNASFDIRFLLAELERVGYSPRSKLCDLCTMQLAREFLPGSRRSLADCCDAYDITIGEAHRASADALATAQLLECYIAGSPNWPGWGDRLAAAEQLAWPKLDTTRTEWMPRPDTTSAPRVHFLERITRKVPEYVGPDECNDYLALLDRALLDRHLSVHESRGLVELAEILGISRTTVEDLHLEYFAAVAVAAWSDGVLTDDERGDLRAVDEHAGFRQLGLPADADTRQDGLSRIAPESASVGVHLRASEPVRQDRARARRIKYSTPIRTPTTARSAPSHGVSTQNHRRPSPVIVNPQARRIASMANTRRGERRVGLVVMTSTPSIIIEKTESLRLMTPREFR